jgi:hypothetical protein
LHIGQALKHWNQNGKGFAITKSSPALSDERYGDEVRQFVTSNEYYGYKARFLPDDAFPNAIVRSWYLGFDKTQDISLVEVWGKSGNLEYSLTKDKNNYIFPSKTIKDIVDIVGTANNTTSVYDIKRVDAVKSTDNEFDTVILIDNGIKTLEKTKKVHRDFGNFGFGMRFQVGGDVTDAYRCHTHHSCLIEDSETIKKDYAFYCAVGETKKQQKLDAIAALFQIRHPLNAWLHAHTRTSEQSSRAPQFKFCCRIPTNEFYKQWVNGKPTVQEYFDYWKIPSEYQEEILGWYSKYV